MDPFALVMVVVVGGGLVGVVLLGLLYPGSGAAQLDWRPTRAAEVEHESELDDLRQLQEAVNAKRRARGAEELTEAGLRAEVAADLRAGAGQGEDPLVEEDVAEMLELRNRRRAARGQAPQTREELEREVLGG